MPTKNVLNKLELSKGKYLLNAGAAMFCDCDINELQMTIPEYSTNKNPKYITVK